MKEISQGICVFFLSSVQYWYYSHSCWKAFFDVYTAAFDKTSCIYYL